MVYAANLASGIAGGDSLSHFDPIQYLSSCNFSLGFRQGLLGTD